ncbi:NUDIX hydrolase [Rhodosalinus sp. 5P4]|uniref:NUDIX hydrolase n=1 Tax=Rhodosalinus sp. 5P4 TaxID=3239196 RepID=UPI0035235AE5
MTLVPGQNWTGYSDAAADGMLHRQVAALCHRNGGAEREVLLVTSRDTKRWILPKGWPVEGCDAAESALQEAWEEAGVIPEPSAPVAPVGIYHYLKRKRVWPHPFWIEAQVFAVSVASLANRFPEAGQRDRRWVPTGVAARMVGEPGLRELIARF